MNEDAEIESLINELQGMVAQQGPANHNMVNPANSFGSNVLSIARSDLGPQENIGKNDGTRIREYFKHFNSPAKQDWCAAAVSSWMIEAGGGPISGGLGAKNIATQFESVGKWVPKDKLTPADFTPGNIVVWSRGDPGSWHGHIGVIESFNGQSFTSIEGNSGPKVDSVVRNTHSISEPSLLGVGLLSNYEPQQKAASVQCNTLLRIAHCYQRLARRT